MRLPMRAAMDTMITLVPSTQMKVALEIPVEVTAETIRMKVAPMSEARHRIRHLIVLSNNQAQILVNR